MLNTHLSLAVWGNDVGTDSVCGFHGPLSGEVIPTGWFPHSGNVPAAADYMSVMRIIYSPFPRCTPAV